MQRIYFFSFISILFMSLLMSSTTAIFAEQKEADLGKAAEVTGKLATVEKLQNLIHERQYDLIPSCFSSKYKSSVERALKENREKWLKAWTLNKEQMTLYKQMIIRGESHFILEDGEWKISEN